MANTSYDENVGVCCVCGLILSILSIIPILIFQDNYELIVIPITIVVPTSCFLIIYVLIRYCCIHKTQYETIGRNDEIM